MEVSPTKTNTLESYFQPRTSSSSGGNHETSESESKRICLSREGRTEYIHAPESFESLVEQASRIFQLKKEEVELRGVNSQIYTATNFASIKPSQTLFVFSIAEQGELKVPQEFTVDITPDKNILLKAGTAEYDVPSAIAELVDNSIQAVRLNPPGSKLIQIRISKDKKSSKVGSIIIWDNGTGMNADDLRSWATMGVSQSDRDENRNVIMNNGGTFSDKGFISRFGVGAKKAAFYLGSKITVCSKVSNSPWVNQTTLSPEVLREFGSNWRVNIKVRKPERKELKYDHFTLIKITNLNFQYDDFDEEIEELTKQLAHIYYYYTHPKEDPESKKKNSDSEGENEEKENEEEKAKEVLDIFDIKVNGHHLHSIEEDMLSQYIKNGKNSKELVLKIKIGEDRISTVKLNLMYFPYDDRETLPIPQKLSFSGKNENSDGSEVPLIMRKPGIHVFWNERLIKDAHIPLLNGFEFTTPGKIEGHKLEEKWFNRVMGFLFINSDFPVTHNKMHICKEDFAFKALFKYNDRGTEKTFRKWLLDCHLSLDQETQYFGEKYVAKENKTYCEYIKRGKDTIKKGDAVMLNIRPKIAAHIQQMYYKGTSDNRLSEGFATFTPFSYKTLENVDYPLARIKNKLSPDDVKQYNADQKARMPGSLKLFEGDSVRLPPDTLTAGEKIKYITCAIYDSQRIPKIVEKQILDEEKIEITFQVYYHPSDASSKNASLVHEKRTVQYYKVGRYSFSDVKCFDKVGKYSLRFEVNRKGVTPVDHSLEVTPSGPKSLHCSVAANAKDHQSELVPSGSFIAHVGDTFPPIEVKQMDQFDNVVPFAKKNKEENEEEEEEEQAEDDVKVKVTCKLTSKETSQSQEVVEIPLNEPLVNLTPEGTIVLSKLMVKSAEIPSKVELADAILEVNVEGELPSAKFPFSISAGKPSQIELLDTDLATEDSEVVPEYKSKSSLPSFKIVLRDAWGNIVKRTNSVFQGYSIEIRSECLKNTIKCNFTNGIAECPKVKLYHTNQEEIQQITFVVIDKQNMEVTATSRYFKLIPSNDPAYIELLLEEEVEGGTIELLDNVEQDTGINVSATVGQVLEKIKVQILNEQKKPLPRKMLQQGSLEVTWSNDKVATVAMDENDEEETVIQLPTLELPKKITDSSTKYSVVFVQQESDQKALKRDFRVHLNPDTVSGYLIADIKESIRCGEIMTFNIGCRDEYGNKKLAFSEEERESILSTTMPEVAIESLEGDPLQVLHCKVTYIDEENKHPYQCKLQISGSPSVIGITVKHPKNILQSIKVNATLVEGMAVALRANKVKNLALSVQQDETLEDILISSVDEWGNVAKLDNIALTMKCKPSPPCKLPDKLILNNGIAILKDLEIFVAKGKFQIEIDAKTIQLESCCINLEVAANPDIPETIKIVEPSQSLEMQDFLAGSTLPTISVQVLSGTGDPIIASQAGLVLALGNDDNRLCCSSFDLASQTFHFEGIAVPTIAGNLSLKFMFRHQSGHLEKEMQINVVPGPPSQLECTSNIKLPSRARPGSLLFEKLHLDVLDEHGNTVTDIPSDAEVQISAILSPEDVDEARIEGEQTLLSLYGVTKKKIKNGKVKFENIRISEDEVKVSGMYNLIFTPYLNNLTLPWQPKSLHFLFQGEEDLQQKTELQQRSMELRTSMEKKKKEKKVLEEQLKDKSEPPRDVVEQQNQLLGKLQKAIGADYFGKMKELDNPVTIALLKESFETELETIKRTTRRPPTFIRNHIVDEMIDNFNSHGESTGIVGVIAELAFVEDDKEAAMLAKILSSKFSAVILKDSQAFDKYYAKYKNSQESVQMVALDNLGDFYNKRHLQQSGSQPPSGHLPLKLPDGAPTQGFLGHAVNRIQLRPKHEYLRRTLFWTLYKEVLVFDTLADANAYRKWAVGRGFTPHAIIAVKEGEIIDSTGFVKVGDKRSQRQNTVSFGSLPPQEHERFKFLKNHLIPLLSELLEVSTKSKEFKDRAGKEREKIQSRIEEMRKEYGVEKEEYMNVQKQLAELTKTDQPAASKHKKRSREEANEVRDNEAPTKTKRKRNGHEQGHQKKKKLKDGDENV